MKRRIFVAVVLYFTFASLAFGLDEIIEKKVFKMDALTLVSGKQIPTVEIGYETYGKLSPAKDNGILICHYFSGNSNAAGKYSKDARPGYWDKIIGPGLPFDTNRFFIISSDILGNHRPKNPHVTTTGPASIDPKTGKPYGNTFPLFTIRDIVAVQHALVKSMGINKLKAVSKGTKLKCVKNMGVKVIRPSKMGLNPATMAQYIDANFAESCITF